ncbi:WXG100 family type VII secretion target [Defluviitalea phaphyphila]|uniref:WXG100 family type VII secretion target n=1 Tax=Defluviitalea phaphyphila TaxID=1473580 RepID=UPI00072FEE20|nr:WXG100 family type VII secretion target [Defluviitalea phaphyphila]
MGQRIKLDSQQVRSFVSEIKAYNSQAKQMMRGVQQEVDEAQQVWKGDSAEAYAKAFTEVRKEVENQMEQFLEALADNLNEVAKAMMEMESDIASSISIR